MRNMFLNWCKNLWTQWKISCMNQHDDVSKNYIFAHDVLEVGISCFFHKNIGNETTFWFFFLSIDWLLMLLPLNDGNWFILQVDKLRILSESLANSTLKAEKRIVDHRFNILLMQIYGLHYIIIVAFMFVALIRVPCAMCHICDVIFRYDTKSHYSRKNTKGEDKRSSWKVKELKHHSNWPR